ncbi:MAG: TonB-dependent receptor, partial [Chitinophagaceae bacterium]
MFKSSFYILLFSLASINAFTQTGSDTSIAELEEIRIQAFEQGKQRNASIALVKRIDQYNSDRYNKTSLVQAFNTIAGVRMEERSPGSYRINIRGSSLRAPFGVRNVKVYWNDIPLT